MRFDASLSNFINHPNDYHLEMEGDNLKAIEGEAKVHHITHEKLLELKNSSNSTAQAVFKTLREKEIGIEIEQSFFSRFIQFVTSRDSNFRENLAQWVEEKIGTDEYENRITAAQRILDCWENDTEQLDLSSLVLTSLPFVIGNLSNLKQLFLSDNELSSIPREIGSLSKLTMLVLSKNKFTSIPPEIGNLKNLHSLNLSRNELTSIPPEIGNLKNLQNLFISNNQLTSIPSSIKNLTKLEDLNLSGNRLTSLPSEIGNFYNLERFNFSQNLLTSIPLSCARLPKTTEILATNNHMSLTSIQAFQAEIARVRSQSPDLGPQFEFSIYEEAEEGLPPPHEEALPLWEETLETAFPKSAFPKIWKAHEQGRSPNDAMTFYEPLLSHEKRNLLEKFLHRLKKTEDYKNENTSKLVILRVDRMLHGAAVNEEFREKLFGILEDALETCGDRVTDAFDLIEIQWYLYCGAKELDQAGVAKLLLGLDRLYHLDKFIWKELKKAENEGNRFGDQIEVFLFYHVKLKDKLGLPASTEGMLYPRTAGVSDDKLSEAEYEVRSETSNPHTIISILTASDIWAEKLRENHPELFNEIDEDIQDRMDRLYDKQQKMSDQEYRNENDKLMDEKKKRTNALVLKLTPEWVKKHYDEIL